MREDTLSLLSRIAPELYEAFSRRALVLSRVAASQPIGRRALAEALSLTEREVRFEADALRERGFLVYGAAGMSLTEKGMEELPEAREFSRLVYGLTTLEKELSDALRVPHVTVAESGANEEDSLRQVGRAAAQRLQKLLSPGMTVAVAGGRTMLSTARAALSGRALNAMIVPARGGVGSALETQASTVASVLAKALGAHFRPLHLPDNLEEGALLEVQRQPEVRETLELLSRADVIVASVGRADVMALQHALAPAQREELLAQGAVGEALGDFFDDDGRVLYRASTFSKNLGARKPACAMVAVAAGEDKARALLAAVKWRAPGSLVVDERAARKMLSLMRNA